MDSLRRPRWKCRWFGRRVIDSERSLAVRLAKIHSGSGFWQSCGRNEKSSRTRVRSSSNRNSAGCQPELWSKPSGSGLDEFRGRLNPSRLRWGFARPSVLPVPLSCPKNYRSSSRTSSTNPSLSRDAVLRTLDQLRKFKTEARYRALTVGRVEGLSYHRFSGAS